MLHPGGIAIITTPAPSWSKIYIKSKNQLKNLIKILLFRKVIKKPFFQYEYYPWTLKKHIEGQGFYISRYSGADWLYTFTELGNHSDKFIKKDKLGYKISHSLENSFLSFLGAQAIVIAIKKDDLMHCFSCGMKTAKKECLKKYDVPICCKCESNSNVSFYEKGNKVAFHKQYIISPSLKPPENKVCDECKSDYITDTIFEDYGLIKDICPVCLHEKNISIQLSNTSIQPIWRRRSIQ